MMWACAESAKLPKSRGTATTAEPFHGIRSIILDHAQGPYLPTRALDGGLSIKLVQSESPGHSLFGRGHHR